MMAELLIGDIALGLKEYVEANDPAIKQEPNVTFENYKAASWGSLTDTEAYQNYLADKGVTSTYILGIGNTTIQSHSSQCH